MSSDRSDIEQARRESARKRQADFRIAAVDAYVRGTMSGPHDAEVITGCMSLGGHDFEFRAVIAAP
jgi:hypothetical protein